MSQLVPINAQASPRIGQLSKRSAYFRVLAYLKPYKRHFLFALLCMVAYGASDGVIPFLVKHILDGVFKDRNSDLLLLLPIILLAFAIFRAAFDFGQQFLMGRLGHWIVRDMRRDLQSHLLDMSPEFFVRRSSADIVSCLTSDVILVRTLLTDSAAAVLRDVIRILALMGTAFYLDPFLALVAFIVFPVGIYPVYRFGKRMRRLSRLGQEAIGAVSSVIQENMQGNRVVKIFCREDFERQRFARENEELTKTFVKAERVRAISGPINEVLASLVIAAVIIYGGYSVINGIRSQGDFIAFLLSVFLLYDPFKKLSRINSTIQQGIAGAERIFEILDRPIDIRDPAKPLNLGSSNRLEFENVSFSYPGRNGDVSTNFALENINLKIEPGTKIALVGFSGAGKSTLVDLATRFIDPTSGLVKLGGIDLRELKLADIRSKIALVSQHTYLFNDTIFNNIAYGKAGASAEQVEAAAKSAYALDFIRALPDGFESKIGEGGHSLSGGERQRLAIARAILKDAPILILDEATASLDNKSEREVQAALEALEKNRTTIVIAHRLSTVRHADRVIVLSAGRIVETGTHDELLACQGEYARLYQLQFAAVDSAVANATNS